MTTPALDGVRVLSVGHTLPGLYCLAALRDLGADVTRIERPASAHARFAAVAGGFPVRSLHEGTSRCALDLKDARGAAAFRRMAATADVVLEGLRPGAAARLGIDHATLEAANPRLVHVAISGYGQDGPWRQRAGHDVNYLAVTGALGLAGEKDRAPALAGITWADGLAGISAALNVVAALHARTRDGEGRGIDLAITDAPLFLLGSEIEHARATGAARSRGDTHLGGAFPWYGVFETADGRWVAVGAVEAPFYENLCRLLELPELVGRQNDPSTRSAFAAAFRRRTREEWTALAADQDVCVTPVLATDEALATPPAARAIDGDGLVRSPVRLAPAPRRPGRSTDAVLTAFGFGADEIRALRDCGVITP